MSLSRKEIFGLVGAFGAVALTAIIHIGIREWYQPDLRYEVGGYYSFQDSAVTSLRIANSGHSDAEDTIIAVNFNHPIRDVAIDSQAVTFAVRSGKIGDTSMTLSVERLVPEQSVSIFFAVERDGVSSQSLTTDFLTSLTFKGGKGKTGSPTLFPMVFTFLSATIVYIALLWAVVTYSRLMRKPHYMQISQMIELGINGHNSGLSRQDMVARIEALTKKYIYRKDTLRAIAIRAYDVMSDH